MIMSTLVKITNITVMGSMCTEEYSVVNRFKERGRFLGKRLPDYVYCFESN